MSKQYRHFSLAALTLSILALATTTTQADAPRVVKMVPENGDTSVDPTTSEMRVVFDREMDPGGFSFCGGGPKFPEVVERPTWINKTTVVLKVRLKPGHDYALSLNCPSATSFRSADGTALDPVPWEFSTSGEAESSGAPLIVEMVPQNDATDVDPSLKEMRIVFDRPMNTGGFSFCGGGPNYPNIVGKTKWINDTTIVLKVKLEPDHDYRLSINCPSAQNFRSADGTPVEPKLWSFSTAAEKAKKLSKKKQKKLNTRSLKALMATLRDSYSHYDLRVKDWKSLEKEHHQKIVSSKSTRTWVKRVAKMLAEAKDVHLWMKYGDLTTATYKRKIKRNYNPDGIEKALPNLTQRSPRVFTARTDDNIAYVAILTLSHENKEELNKVENILKEFMDCKALILDLRPNSGGDEGLAMPIAATFIKGTKTYAKHITRDPDAKDGFTAPYERKITGKPDAERFRGPVAVLTGPGIMSSGEAFVLMMKQGEDVTLVGEKTYGSSGNPMPHTLDNGVEIFIPSWRAMLPDGTYFEGKGIKPDISVKGKSSEFKKGDPVIQRALKLLREKTK